MIAGAVVGGSVGKVLLAFTALYLLQRRQRQPSQYVPRQPHSLVSAFEPPENV